MITNSIYDSSCTLRVPNTHELEMKSSSNDAVSKPTSVVHMILDDKDYIYTESASVFSNEIFELSKDLFYVLHDKLRKLKFYKDYCEWVDVDTDVVIEEVCVIFVFVPCFVFLAIVLGLRIRVL